MRLTREASPTRPVGILLDFHGVTRLQNAGAAPSEAAVVAALISLNGTSVPHWPSA
jgi:hypothetical protein